MASTFRYMWLCLLLFSAAGVYAQVPDGYEIVEITTNPEGNKERPQINNCGQVVWGRRAGPDTIDNFIYENGVVSLIGDGSQVYTDPRINNRGTIVMRAGPTLGGPWDLAIFEDGELVDMVDTVSAARPNINDAGHLAIVDDLSGNFSHTEVFLYDGNTLTQITDNGETNNQARINNSGQFVAFVNNVVPVYVIMYDGSEVIELTPTEGRWHSGTPDLNDYNQVVWLELDLDFGDKDRRIISWADGEYSVLVEDADIVRPRNNNRGDLVYCDATTGLCEVVLVRDDGTTFVIPNNGLSCHADKVNDWGEMAWHCDGKSAAFNHIYLFRLIPDEDHDNDGPNNIDDNCPIDVNPLQENSDDDCMGDICDLCPADSTNSCDLLGSGAWEVDSPSGGLFAVENGSVTVDIPPNALPDAGTVSVTSMKIKEPNVAVIVDGLLTTGTLLGVHDLLPETSFNSPVTVTFVQDVSQLMPIEQAAVNVFRYNQAGDLYQSLPTTSCSLTEDTPGTVIATCEASLGSFSTYAMIAPQPGGTPIPTMTEWGLVAMSTLLVVAGCGVVSRRRATAA